MATTNRLQIGTTSGTVASMPYPNSDPIPLEKNSFLKIQETQSGDKIFEFIKKKKIDYSLTFIDKVKADYETLKAFCDVPIFYYVVVQNSDTSDKLLDDFYYLQLDPESINVNSDTYRRNFTINLIAK